MELREPPDRGNECDGGIDPGSVWYVSISSDELSDTRNDKRNELYERSKEEDGLLEEKMSSG